jgi:hypothetical protein
VHGLVPDGAADVEVTPTGGSAPVRAATIAAGDDLLFLARLPGTTGAARIVALSADGALVDELAGPSVPPPPPVPGQPIAPVPGARGAVQVPWAVAGISRDRRSVDVVAHASAGGCTRPSGTQALDTPEGMRLVVHVDVPLNPDPCPPADDPIRYTIDLPRALAPGEQVLGECVVDGTDDGVVCAELRAAPAG